MLRIKIVAAGRVKESYYQAAAAEYIKRCSPHAKIEVQELDEADGSAELTAQGLSMLRAAKGLKIALDSGGRQLSSTDAAKKLADLTLAHSDLTFFIGGSEGLAECVKSGADFVLSLGAPTLPHSLARVVLLEQIYRTLNINAGGKYHK